MRRGSISQAARAGRRRRVGDGGGVEPGAADAGRRGVVAQPATISSAAVAQASRVTSERREPDKMVWFFLEALVALLIAVAIVAWTMGLEAPQAAARSSPGDADRDKNP